MTTCKYWWILDYFIYLSIFYNLLVNSGRLKGKYDLFLFVNPYFFFFSFLSLFFMNFTQSIEEE